MTRSLSFVVLLAAALGLAGCSAEEPPTRRLQWGPDLIDMAISEDWDVERDDAAERIYAHPDYDGLRLHVSGGTEEFGHPLRVTDVKSMIGREINHEFGGAITRMSLAGNAMIRYARERVDDYDDPLHCVEWILAKPVGHGDFARVEISLRMPPEVRARPEVQALIEVLDRRVGDAKIPRV